MKEKVNNPWTQFFCSAAEVALLKDADFSPAHRAKNVEGKDDLFLIEFNNQLPAGQNYIKELKELTKELEIDLK